MFRACTGSRSISSTCGLLLHVRFLFHLSIASGRLRCLVTGVPPQPNSPTDQCLEASDWNAAPGSCGRKPHLVREAERGHSPTWEGGADVQWPPVPSHSMSKTTVKVVVFHCWFAPGLCVLSKPHPLGWGGGDGTCLPPMLHPPCCCTASN
jgi:hypothetical protein